MKNSFEDKFLLGFWGYRSFGEQDTPETVAMWKDAGFNTVLSFIYHVDDDKPQEMLQMLDLCKENGLKVILYDDRIHCHRLREMSEEMYEKAVLRSVNEFGRHPAAAAFFVSDEPNAATLPLAEKAVRIVQKHSPIPAFVNFYPMWRSKDYVDLMGVPGEKIGELYSEFLKKSGAACIAYDCYSQMDAREPEAGLNGYFDNLNTYHTIAKQAGVPMIPSLLCTGHWAFRQPALTDLRWQLSTAVAHGAKGALWFMLYDNDDGLGNSPIDISNEKQPSYYDLRKANREFMRQAGELVADLELEEVYHYCHSYGGVQCYAEGYDVFLKSFAEKYRDDAVISRFRNRKTGRYWYMFVNASRAAGNQFSFRFDAPYTACSGKKWVEAGGFVFVELKEETK